MLHQLTLVNKRLIERMKEIEGKSKERQVTAAVRAEIRTAESWQSVLKKALTWFVQE
jgi:hypothetical protein